MSQDEKTRQPFGDTWEEQQQWLNHRIRIGGCESCGELEGVEEAPVRTAYHWNGEGENPNKPPHLCPPCLEEYNDYWDEMWASYYGGRI